MPATGQGNTNASGKVYICATPATTELNQAAYEALTWVEISNVGSMGEIGNNQPINNYTTWNDGTMKAKGTPDYGSPELEIGRDTGDAGQDALRVAATLNSPHAFKVERNDALTGGGTNTMIYNRALVTGPRRPQGRSEDFDLEIFTLGMFNNEVVVDPT